MTFEEMQREVKMLHDQLKAEAASREEAAAKAKSGRKR